MCLVVPVPSQTIALLIQKPPLSKSLKIDNESEPNFMKKSSLGLGCIESISCSVLARCLAKTKSQNVKARHPTVATRKQSRTENSIVDIASWFH